MTRKSQPQPPLSRRGVVWFEWKLVIAFSVALCFLALLRIQLQYNAVTTLSSPLSVERSQTLLHEYSIDRPKLAFCFLARRDLPLDFMWDRFFKGVDHGNFSIYIHSVPGFVFNEATTRSRYIYNRQLNNSIKVVWGKSSMIAAERLLFASALEDQSNERFLLLSDSFLHTKETRYSVKMSPIIPEEKWRKGTQWIALIRSHAEVIVNDDTVFSVFNKYCKRCPLLGTTEAWLFLKQNRRNCIPDEHYVQTLLTMRGLENELERRTVTYTVWNVTGTKYEAKSWHPVTFTFENSGPEDIKRINKVDNVYYESESRTEWCKADLKPVPCFLFARRFTNEAAMHIMTEGLIGSSKNTTL